MKTNFRLSLALYSYHPNDLHSSYWILSCAKSIWLVKNTKVAAGESIDKITNAFRDRSLSQGNKMKMQIYLWYSSWIVTLFTVHIQRLLSLFGSAYHASLTHNAIKVIFEILTSAVRTHFILANNFSQSPQCYAYNEPFFLSSSWNAKKLKQ